MSAGASKASKKQASAVVAVVESEDKRDDITACRGEPGVASQDRFKRNRVPKMQAESEGGGRQRNGLGWAGLGAGWITGDHAQKLLFFFSCFPQTKVENNGRFRS